MPNTAPGIWYHTTHPITFTLAVDDIGIKHFNKDDANLLFTVIQDKYSVTTDWSGDSYLGLTIN